jgi:thioredoxin 1
MANENVLVVTNSNFEGEVLKSDKPVMVDFWAPWCGPCKTIGPIIDEIANEYNGRAVVGKINVDDEGELARKYRVMSIPTLLFFKNGEVVERLIGARPKNDLTKILDGQL